MVILFTRMVNIGMSPNRMYLSYGDVFPKGRLDFLTSAYELQYFLVPLLINPRTSLLMIAMTSTSRFHIHCLKWNETVGGVYKKE